MAVAEILRRETRGVDIVCRWSGEEFAVLLGPFGVRDAINVAERIRRAVANMQFRWGDAVLPLTTSIGVATSGPTPEAIEQQLARCDEALYRAKAEGRNRWILSSDEDGADKAAAIAAAASAFRRDDDGAKDESAA